MLLNLASVINADNAEMLWGFLQRSFAINPARGAHVIAGGSMGGFSAYNLGFKYRDQFGTIIPLRGDASSPDTSILTVVGNVLHNAFVRAYLPKLNRSLSEIEGLTFGPGSVADPGIPGEK